MDIKNLIPCTIHKTAFLEKDEYVTARPFSGYYDKTDLCKIYDEKYNLLDTSLYRVEDEEYLLRRQGL